MEWIKHATDRAENDPIVIAAAISVLLQPRSSLIGLSTTAMAMLLAPAASTPAIITIATITQPQKKEGYTKQSYYTLKKEKEEILL